MGCGNSLTATVAPEIKLAYNAANLVIIWADPNVHQLKSTYANFLMQLQQIGNELHLCQSAQECVKQFDKTGEKKILLVVSNELGEQLIPLVWNFSSLDSIYIWSFVRQ